MNCGSLRRTRRSIPSKVFNTNVAGDAMMMVEVPRGIGPIAVAAITDEPTGGSHVPTGSIHLVKATSSSHAIVIGLIAANVRCQ